jgi:hypothetical protein
MTNRPSIQIPIVNFHTNSCEALFGVNVALRIGAIHRSIVILFVNKKIVFLPGFASINVS